MTKKVVGKVKPTKKVAKKPTKQATQKADASIAKLTNRIKELEKLLEQANAEVQRLKDKYEPPKEEPEKEEPEKWEWDKKTVDYVECFARVCAYMDKNTGYIPDLYENDVDYDENTEVDIMVYDGEYGDEEHETWENVRDFVGGNEKAESIFERCAWLEHRYYKLASRWLASFANSCKSLGNVKLTKDRTPAGIMKALDKAGL